MNGATALVSMLSGYGVDVIFGVPGDTNVALYEALRMTKGAPRHILCRDERSAVFMADCYARLSGKPGVAEVPSGAGALYGLPGVAEANKSSVPLILLVNDIPQPGVGRGTLTELPVQDLFKPISKRAETLAHVRKLPEVVRRAFREATGGRPGAVVLALPEDILYQDLPSEGVSLHVEPQCRQAPSYRSRPADADLDSALNAILAAERPLIVAGGGANRSAAAEAITAFAERLGIPVVTTITGQGVIRDDHKLGIGIIGDNGFHPHAVWALGRADLVIYVGCRMGSVATMNWQWPVPNGETRIVQVDLEPEVIGNTYAIDFPLVGDARAVVEALIAKAPADHASVTAAWVDEINSRRADFWDVMAPHLQSDEVPLRPERVIETLNRCLPMPCNVVSDAGTPTPYATRFLRLRDPQSKLVIPRFYGGLGYAIPAVIGAYFAAPHLRPVGLFGDGSLGMSAGELETLSRLQVPAVLIHFNNACFGWIKALQRVVDRDRARKASEHSPAVPVNDPTFSVDFGKYDMSRLASVYGIRSFRVETPAQLEAALREAFELNEPVFIDVAVESIADRLPPVFSWLKKVGADPAAVGVQAALQEGFEMAQSSKNIAVLGAGQIGAVIAGMLAEQGHKVTLADASDAQLGLSVGRIFATKVVDAGDLAALRAFLKEQEIVVSACPYFLNRGIAQIAAETGTHYFDLTEDVATTAYIKDLAAGADVMFAPQCGLAPGFICVLGAEMASRFDSVRTIKMRVGALPLYPTNALRYNVTWSIDGLINEYCNPCEIVFDGKPIAVPALEGVEGVMIDGVAYEAFNTSGGLGTLTETLAGKVRDMSYKTLRYPGHAEIMKLLLQGLGLADDRETMRRILNRAAPFTHKDVVVIFVTGIGERNGRMEEDSIVLRYDGRPELGAIQLTTAAGCVAMVELFLAGKLPAKGFVRQEDASLSDFLSTREGSRLAREARSSETGDFAARFASKRAA